MATVIIAGILLIVFGLAVKKIVTDHKKGGCASGCSGCGCSCNKTSQQ